MDFIDLLDWTLQWYCISTNANPNADVERLFTDIDELNNFQLTPMFGNIRITLNKVLDQLKNDEYIKYVGTTIHEDDKGQSWSSSIYSSTIKGSKFLSAGGYKSAILREAQIEKDRQTQKELEVAVHKSQIHMVQLTWILAAGTSVAAVYYGLEIVRIHLPCWLSLSVAAVLFLSGACLGAFLWHILTPKAK